MNIPEKDRLDLIHFRRDAAETLMYGSKTSKLRAEQEVNPKIREKMARKPEQFCTDDKYIRQKGKDGRFRIIIPFPIRRDLVDYYHQYYGHIGTSKTITILRRLFTWPGVVML